ncbi:MAG: AAA family ATPase [Acidobacteria bacterium]|nr:AAA family ATPase [Acidobacteriota bacterium]
MNAILFMGLQASGKSTFYVQRFFKTHIRLSMDMLKTRHREQRLLTACIQAKQPVVIDNTNPTPADRQRYIEPLRLAKFRVIGYYFRSELDACLARNQKREPAAIVPEIGIKGTYRKLVLPQQNEGFDELFYVQMVNNGFEVSEWRDEV